MDKLQSLLAKIRVFTVHSTNISQQDQAIEIHICFPIIFPYIKLILHHINHHFVIFTPPIMINPIHGRLDSQGPDGLGLEQSSWDVLLKKRSFGGEIAEGIFPFRSEEVSVSVHWMKYEILITSTKLWNYAIIFKMQLNYIHQLPLLWIALVF
jgi:hypothetical protein